MTLVMLTLIASLATTRQQPTPPVFYPVMLSVDSPTSVPEDFIISGAAYGADLVHVWAFAPSGAVFLGMAVPTQPDPIRQTVSGRYSLLVHAPIGQYVIMVAGRDPGSLAGDFVARAYVSHSVRACQWYYDTFQYVVGDGGASVATHTQQVCR